MGIERKTLSTKVELENELWLEGLRQQSFPWISRSALINLLLTFLRLADAAGHIQLTHSGLQHLLRIPRIPAPPLPARRICPKEKEEIA